MHLIMSMGSSQSPKMLCITIFSYVIHYLGLPRYVPMHYVS